MRPAILIAARYPLLVILTLAMLTVLAISQLGRLEVRVSAEGMQIAGDPVQLVEQRILNTFGSDSVTVVYLQDPDLFEPENLVRVRKAINDIQKSPLVERTSSLFSVTHLQNHDGFISLKPYFDKIPASRTVAESIRDQALGNPMVQGVLLSKDGRGMAINVYLATQDYYRGYDADVTEQIESAIAPLREHLQTVFQMGTASVRAGIGIQIREDQRLIMPLALLVLTITLAISLRRFSAAIVPLLTALISVVWTLGLMAALSIPINVMTSIVPALLIIIGSTEDIHLLVEYQSGIQRKLPRFTAIRAMARNMGTVVFLTFATTCIGFLSISLNSLELLSQFGLMAATGLLFNFIVTVLLVPVSLHYFGALPNSVTQKTETSWYTRAAVRILELVQRYRRAVTVALVLTIVSGVWGTSQLRLNNNVMDYFAKDSDIAMNSRFLHEHLSGVQTLSILLTGTEGTFLQVPYLEQLQFLQDYLRAGGLFDKTVSFADFIAVVNGAIDDEWDEISYLPGRTEVVREYMNFIDHDDVRGLVSADYSQTRILVRHDIESSRQLNEAVEQVRQLSQAQLDTGLSVEVAGVSYLNSRAVDYMAGGQVRSLLLMLAVILALMSLLFLTIKAGLIVVVSNLFPIVSLFGIMGFTGMPIDTGTAMVAAIALGICVDHSMHFMVRYHRLTHRGMSEVKALRETVSEEATPIIATALALAAGFGTLAMSSFPPVARFGMLSALVMLLALVGTFVVMPLLLRYARLITLWDLLSLRFKDAVLKRCPLFKGLRSWHIRKLIVLCEVRAFREDEAILHQGDTADDMYVLLEGRAEVWQTRRDGSTYQVSGLRAGDVFGELSQAAGHRRIADVVAVSAAQVLVLRWQDIARISRFYPRISSRLFHNLSNIVSERMMGQEPGAGQLRDDLTGAYNRSYFQGLLDYTADWANRYDEPVSVMVVSIDGFESLSSEYGQRTANWILRRLTDEFRGRTRKVDILAHWGGDKFAVLLPKTDLATGGSVAERMRQAVADWEQRPPPSLTISAGLACQHDGEDGESVLHRAETERLRAVGDGGNRIAMAG